MEEESIDRQGIPDGYMQPCRNPKNQGISCCGTIGSEPDIDILTYPSQSESCVEMWTKVTPNTWKEWNRIALVLSLWCHERATQLHQLRPQTNRLVNSGVLPVV